MTGLMGNALPGIREIVLELPVRRPAIGIGAEERILRGRRHPPPSIRSFGRDQFSEVPHHDVFIAHGREIVARGIEADPVAHDVGVPLELPAPFSRPPRPRAKGRHRCARQDAGRRGCRRAGGSTLSGAQDLDFPAGLAVDDLEFLLVVDPRPGIDRPGSGHRRASCRVAAPASPCRHHAH